MPYAVGHHNHCAGCGYDLFQQQRGGFCPECGKRIPKTKRLARSKNPKRVNAGLQTSIRAWQRSLRLAVRVTAGVVAIAIAIVMLKGPYWISILCGAAAMVGVLSIVVCRREIARANDRILPIAQQRAHSKDP
jgi:uncharacterized Zn finger protein (UPF0148 family)